MSIRTFEVTLYIQVDDASLTVGDVGDLLASTMEPGDWLLCNDPNMKVVDVDSNVVQVTSTDDMGWTPV